MLSSGTSDDEKMPEMDASTITIMVVKSLLVIGLLHTLYSYRSAKQREAQSGTGASKIPSAAAGAASSRNDVAETVAASSKDEDSDAASKVVTILFASQTGTAEGFAATIAGEA